MRSLAEIRFRLRQEAANALLFAYAPSLPKRLSAARTPLALPLPSSYLHRVRGCETARKIEELAERICEHRFPLLGYVVETGREIRWRRDYVHQVETEAGYFRRVPYLDAAQAGDHKIIWELNRHQHLVVLAQAWLLTGRREFLNEIPWQLESWWEQNALQRGINWTSALEVAFRALSWLWVYHLAGAELSAETNERLLNGLYRHGIHLEHNLSVYFSPNTHLLGEAVALHAIGTLFPAWPRSQRWKELGGRVVREEMDHQVRADGSHFEQSSAYHVYAIDFFLFHAMLETPGDAYLTKLRGMADYLAALSSSDGMIPLLGDDDGGNFFYVLGEQRRFAAGTLASCCVFFGRDDRAYAPEDLKKNAVWWFGERAFDSRPGAAQPAAEARLFADAGVAVLARGPIHIAVDTRAFGHANAGHSHAHALHVICRRAGEDILTDAGTYTYVGEPEWRPRFRGTAFHNTVRVDGQDQADGAGPFRWLKKPASRVRHWSQGDGWRYLDAECEYRNVVHRRRCLWMTGAELLVVVDAVTGGERLEQFWHCGGVATELGGGNYRIGNQALIVLPKESSVRVIEGGEFGWESEMPGQKIERPVIVVNGAAGTAAIMPMALFLKRREALQLSAVTGGGRINLRIGDEHTVEFPEDGDPVIN